METLHSIFKKYRGRKTQLKCAAEIGISDKHLSRVLRHRTPCGRGLAVKIEEWSGGELRAEWFLLPDRLNADSHDTNNR